MKGKENMSDEVKNLIWELVEPQLEMYDRMNLPVERTLLEHKVLDIFQEIESEEDDGVAHATVSAWDDGWDAGHQAASEEIGDMRATICSSIENLKKIMDGLYVYNKGYRY